MVSGPEYTYIAICILVFVATSGRAGCARGIKGGEKAGFEGLEHTIAIEEEDLLEHCISQLSSMETLRIGSR